MGFIQSYFSEKGEYRKSNQDALAILKASTSSGEALLVTVCDGMGGYSQGELASKYCIDRIVDWYKKRFPEIISSLTEGDWRNEVQPELDILIQNINERLVQYGEKYDIKIGSTVTGMLFWQSIYLIFHVGDSRAYLITTEQVRQLTIDDSLVAQHVADGTLTMEEAKSFKKKNILTECVGVSKGVDVKFYLGSYFIGDCYLVCSDGFWHEIAESELKTKLSSEQIQSDEDIRGCLQCLAKLIYERGERDNATVVGIRVV